MIIGKIKFQDILGSDGKKYDRWLNRQEEGYYLTYKSNMYKDAFDYSIEKIGCPSSQPIILARNIKQITNLIDRFILEDRKKDIMER